MQTPWFLRNPRRERGAPIESIEERVEAVTARLERSTAELQHSVQMSRNLGLVAPITPPDGIDMRRGGRRGRRGA